MPSGVRTRGHPSSALERTPANWLAARRADLRDERSCAPVRIDDAAVREADVEQRLVAPVRVDHEEVVAAVVRIIAIAVEEDPIARRRVDGLGVAVREPVLRDASDVAAVRLD